MLKWASLNQCGVRDISANAKKVLESYNWPGNVRELENVIQRAIILCDGSQIDADNLFFDNDTYGNDSSADTDSDGSTINIKDNEYRLIAGVLESVGWSRKQAAMQLGISERTLRYKLSKMRESGYSIKVG